MLNYFLYLTRQPFSRRPTARALPAQLQDCIATVGPYRT